MFNWYHNLRLRWKVLISPALLIIVLAGVGLYAVKVQRANQAAVAALMAGPVRQAETLGDFNSSAWRAQVRLYHLMATAANETDEKKIKELADTTTNALSELSGKLLALDNPAFNNSKTGDKLKELKTTVTSYIKQAKAVIDMADGDAGTALTLMMSATRSFTTIANLTDDLTQAANGYRDNRVASNDATLDWETTLLIAIVLSMIVLGGAASLLISRGISRPVMGIAAAIKRMAEGDFDTALPGLGRKDEIGEISAAVEVIKVKAAEKARSEAEEAAARRVREAEEVNGAEFLRRKLRQRRLLSAPMPPKNKRRCSISWPRLSRICRTAILRSASTKAFPTPIEKSKTTSMRPSRASRIQLRRLRKLRARLRARPWRFRRARPTCRNAPSSRPPAWKRPRHRWKRSRRP